MLLIEHGNQETDHKTVEVFLKPVLQLRSMALEV